MNSNPRCVNSSIRNWFRCLSVCLLCSWLSGANPATAQIFDWNSAASSTFALGPWLPNAPTFVSGADETLNFGSFLNATTPGYTATNSASSFTRVINFNNTYGSPAIIISNTGTLTFNSAGGFAPELNQNGFGVAQIGAFTMANAMSIGGTGAGNLTIAGAITNSAGNTLTINQLGGGFFNTGSSLIFNSAGNFGASSNTVINNGNVAIGSGSAFGANAANLLTINGGSFRLNATGLTVANNFTLNSNLNFLNSNSGVTTGTFSGILSGIGGLRVRNAASVTLNFTGANTFSGDVEFQPLGNTVGGITLSGANGSMANVSNIRMYSNTSLTLDNTVVPSAARLNNAVNLTLYRANLVHQGNSSTQTSSTIGTLNTLGTASITVNPGSGSLTGAGSQLTIGTWNRQANSTAVFSAPNLGATPGANVGTVVITNNPGGDIGGILPYAYANTTTSSTNTVGTFVRWDSATGRIVGLNQATDYQSGPLPVYVNSDATAQYRATSIQGGLGSTTVNSLILDTPSGSPFVGTSVAGTGTLTVTSGAILSSVFGTTSVSAPINNTIATNSLDFGSNPGYVHSLANLNIASTISGNSGLVKSGFGLLVLTGANTYTGSTYVNGGLLSITADNNLGNAANSIQLNGGVTNGMIFNPSNVYSHGSQTSLTSARNIVINESGASLRVNNFNNTMTLNGGISGSGYLYKAGSGTLVLNGANLYTGDTILFDGVLAAANNAALGNAAGQIIFTQGGAGTLQANSSFTSSRNVLLQSNGTFFTNGNNLTLSGVIGTQNNATPAGLVKLGTGDLTLTNTNTYNGGTTIGGTGANVVSTTTGAQTGGRLVLSGANGSIAMSNGITINPGSTLRLDNSSTVNNFRVGRVGVTMNAGSFEVVGHSTNNSSTAIGALSSASFGNTITLDQSTGSGSTTNSLTVTSYTAPSSSQITFVRGTNLGAAAGDRTAVLFNAPPSTFAGILPSFVGSSSATGTPTEFLTLGTAVGGQTPLQIFSAYVSNNPNAGAGAVTNITTSVNLAGHSTVGAARLATGGSVSLTDVFETPFNWTIQSGSLIASGASNSITNTGLGNSTITFGGTTSGGGATAGFGRITNTGSLTVGTKVIFDATNITKFGAGTLTISGTSTATTWNVAQGTLRYGALAPAPLLTTATVNVAPGATLDLNNNGGVGLGNISGFGTVNVGINGLALGAQSGTFAGSLIGSGTMVLNGTGTMTLTGNSSGFSGGWTINAGRVDIGGSNALGTGSITLGSTSGTATATLGIPSVAPTSIANNIIVPTGSTGQRQMIAAANTSGQFTGSLAVNNTSSTNGLVLSGPGSSTALSNGAWTLAGNISGAGAIQWESGNWNFWGNNSAWTGGLNIFAWNAQVMGVGSDTALGTGTVTYTSGSFGGMIRADNGARTLANNFVITGGSNNVTFTGTNDLTLTGGVLLNSAGSNHNFNVVSSGTTTLAGVVSGASGTSSMSQTGFGTLVLSNANTFGGGYTLNSGVLGIGNDQALGSGALSIGEGGILRASGGGRSIANAVTVNGNFGVDGSNPLSLNGTMALGATTRSVVVKNSADTTFGGVISGVGGLTKLGGGTLILSGANAFTGTTTVSAGTLTLSGGSAIIDGGVVNVSNAGAVLNVAANETIGSLAGVSGSSVTVGSNILTTGGNNASTSFAGTISGVGGGLTKVGTGTMTLSGSVSYAGPTLVQAGTLAIGANNVFNGNSNLAVNGGTFSVGGFSDSVNGLLIDIGSVTGTGTLASATTIDGRQGSVYASLAGNVGLNKTTPGLLTLGATNLYTGNTSIADGVLALDVGGSINFSPVIDIAAAGTLDVTATGGYTLAAGQTLTGTGSVTGPLSIGNGSVLAPGNSPGNLTFNGVLDFAASGSYAWEINDPNGLAGIDPGWDLASIAGQLTISSNLANPFVIGINSLTLGNLPGAITVTPFTTYTWTIASASGGITGFNSSFFALDTTNFSSNFNGSFSIVQNGNDLNLQFTTFGIPEPGTFGLLGIGCGIMISLFSSRRRKAGRRYA